MFNVKILDDFLVDMLNQMKEMAFLQVYLYQLNLPKKQKNIKKY